MIVNPGCACYRGRTFIIGREQMQPVHYFLISIIGFGFWPVLMRFASPLPPSWATVGLALSTMIIALGVAVKGGDGFTLKNFGIATVVGIFNGVSTIAYTRLIGWGSQEGTRYVALASAVTPVLMVAIGIILFRDKLSLVNCCGIGVVTLGLYLLNYR